MRRRRRGGGGDPRWITVRFRGECGKCGAPVPKGARAFYFPSSRRMHGSECCGAADTSAGEFEAARFDEAQMTGVWQ